MSEASCYTASQVADQLREPPQRVNYIIRKYRLKPTDTRIFSPLLLPPGYRERGYLVLE